MGDENTDRRDITWGENECQVCNNSTWLSLVIYEQIGANIEVSFEDESFISPHPAPQDEYPIAVCSNCVTEAQSDLAEAGGMEITEVSFTDLKRYLTYCVHPQYVKKLHPDDAKRFARLLD